MIRTLLFIAALAFPLAASAQDHGAHHGHDGHDSHDSHHSHDSDDSHGDHSETQVTLSRTAEIDAALAAGGEPVVVEVLGVVCDFCAKAMNKTFGRRDDVSAVYVDLDTKTLNLVLTSQGAMDNEEIERVVIKSGYKSKAIHRGAHLVGEGHASDPA